MAKRRRHRDPNLKPGDSRVKPSACPSCAYVMDCATCVFDKTAVPKPDDFSVCLACGEVLRFDEDMELQRLVRSDVDVLDTQPLLRRQIRQVMVAIKRVHNTMGRPADRRWHS